MSRPPAEGPAGERRAWGWVGHLRTGGTTPWRVWSGEAPHGGRLLPGAQQLELLRRLNEAGRPDPSLVERVLAASAAGRGRPDLELAGAVEPPRFGPAPVDPADLAADELLRVAAGLVAEDVVATRPDPAPQPGPSVLRRVAAARPGRAAYRLVGDPWLADPLRAELVARGRRPGGRSPLVLVLATDVPTMLTHAWAHRALAEAGPSWEDWLAGARRAPRLPPRVDVEAAARHWAGRAGRHRVRVVAARGSALPAAVARLLGVRRPLPLPPPVAADSTELGRRVVGVLGLLAPPEGRRRLVQDVLRPRLESLGGAELAVAERHQGWVRRRAEQVHGSLLRAGYPVAGDLDVLLEEPVADGRVTAPDDERVLGLALRLLLDTDDRGGPGASTREPARMRGER